MPISATWDGWLFRPGLRQPRLFEARTFGARLFGTRPLGTRPLGARLFGPVPSPPRAPLRRSPPPSTEPAMSDEEAALQVQLALLSTACF